MNEEEIVRYYLELQRPMTKEEEHGYWELQREQYWSKFVPMTPVIDVGKTLRRMMAEEKSGK